MESCLSHSGVETRLKNLEDRMTKHEQADEVLLQAMQALRESIGPWSAAFKLVVFIINPLLGILGTLIVQHYMH